jgi:hypothetical protein
MFNKKLPDEIIVKTQKDFDAIPKNYKGTVYIEGGTYYDRIVINYSFDEARVIVRGEAYAELWGSSHAVLRESSHAKLFGEAMVSAKSAKEIICNGYNVISLTKKAKQGMNIVCNKNSYIKIIPEFKPTFTEFYKLYPVVTKAKKAIMYKAVRKDQDGTYRSDWSPSFIYKIGEIHTEKCAPKDQGSCSAGLHVAFKSWARAYGASWNNFALLECEVDIKDIIVCEDTDGKVRTPKLKVLREVPREEWYD